jgi:protein AF-17/10
MKKTDSNGWAHVICALYIPEITFINVRTMEPIVTSNMRTERLNKKCHICEQNNRYDLSEKGVCVNCSKSGCKFWFHVTW